jgi:DNA-binding MarR family transcriptional regulator
LPRGSDHAFRKLLYDFFTVANRIGETRRHLGARIGLTGPQFSMMMAIAELEGPEGVSVGRLANYLHVAPTFVTAESGKLLRKDYIGKRTDAGDRRISRLRIAGKGRAALRSLLPLLQRVNDQFFDLESRAEFKTLCQAFDRMVEGSLHALELAAAGGRRRAAP